MLGRKDSPRKLGIRQLTKLKVYETKANSKEEKAQGRRRRKLIDSQPIDVCFESSIVATILSS